MIKQKVVIEVFRNTKSKSDLLFVIENTASKHIGLSIYLANFLPSLYAWSFQGAKLIANLDSAC